VAGYAVVSGRMGLSEALSIKFDIEKVERFDTIKACLTKNAMGIEVSRSAVIRLLIDIGLEQVETRLARGGASELAELIPEPGE
jgi:hypothetical protein